MDFLGGNGWPVQKRLNGLRCYLDGKLVWAEGTMYMYSASWEWTLAYNTEYFQMYQVLVDTDSMYRCHTHTDMTAAVDLLAAKAVEFHQIFLPRDAALRQNAFTPCLCELRLFCTFVVSFVASSLISSVLSWEVGCEVLRSISQPSVHVLRLWLTYACTVQVDISSPVMWISQVRGSNKIRLTPRHPCDTACSTLYAVLHEGDTGQ